MAEIDFCFYSKNATAIKNLHKEFIDLCSWLPQRFDNMFLFFFGKEQFDAIKYGYQLFDCDSSIEEKDGLYNFFINTLSSDMYYELIPCMLQYIEEAYQGEIKLVYSTDEDGELIMTTNDRDNLFFKPFARLSYIIKQPYGWIVKHFDTMQEAEDFVEQNKIHIIDTEYDLRFFDCSYKSYA